MEIKKRFFKTLPKEAITIREKVFVQEQGFTNEFDETDKNSIHIVLFSDNSAIATGRLVKDQDENTYIIGRVAVLEAYRKLHLGNLILTSLEEKAKELGATKICVSAQCRVQTFYEKHDYNAVGDVYYDEYCKHIKMVKTL